MLINFKTFYIMKKLFLCAAIAVFGLMNVNAQEFKLGPSVGYLSEIGAIGFGVDAVYSLNETWEVAVAGTYASEDPVSWTAIDANGHYMFDESFYVLAGVQYLSSKVDIPNIGGFGVLVGSASVTDFGFNAGAGYRYSLSDSISLFGEAKYVAIATGYVHAKVGVLFNL